MKEDKESIRDKLIVAFFQTLLLGVVLVLFSFWLDLRLETFKKELTNDTERLRASFEYNAAIIQQRQAAYLEIQQAARELTELLEIFYYLSAEPSTSELWRSKLRALENNLGLGSGAGRSTFVTKRDVLGTLNGLVALREKYEFISSERVNIVFERFLETIMQDLSDGELEENGNETFHTAAIVHARDAFNQLDLAIDQALRFDDLPFE
ncbi:MAG TPA: hypothetical protein VI451_17775 [Anaerolineales bacterium]|nr:hypothetical protein [Anaerolineales bacterium]